MDNIEFNEYITRFGEDSIENMLMMYCNLKKMSKEDGIINENNKNKFIELLKRSGKCIKDMDFSYENFQGVELNEMQFVNCKFIETNMENSELDAIEFYSCILDSALLCNAVMECACFVKCSCVKTNFTKAHLLSAYIQDSDWSDANISGVNLLEVEAHNWEINRMKVNENTAIVDGEFYEVNWSKMDVSRLNISLNQVKYFLQSTNGGRSLQVYDDFVPSPMQKREDAIFKALQDAYEQNEMTEYKNHHENQDLIFISYASEQEQLVREFYEARKRKLHLWMDAELIREDELKVQVDKILNCCTMAVVFLSKEYLIKAWTRYELWRLLEEKKKRSLNIIYVQLTEGLGDMIKQYSDSDFFTILKDIAELDDCLNI